MHDIHLPIDTLSTSDSLKQYELWEAEVLAKLETLGYPTKLWPSGDMRATSFVMSWKQLGRPNRPAIVNAPVDRAPYDGPPVAEYVVKLFQGSFHYLTDALFCITKGEDWWPYEKSFLVNDAKSYMKYLLYTTAINDQSVLEAPLQKKRGRPRNDARNTENHLTKTERAERYRQWLVDCEAHRRHVAELKSSYETALATYLSVKKQGAPKWVG